MARPMDSEIVLRDMGIVDTAMMDMGAEVVTAVTVGAVVAMEVAEVAVAAAINALCYSQERRFTLSLRPDVTWVGGATTQTSVTKTITATE